MTYGLGCQRIIADCFSNVTQWNIEGIHNGDSLLSAEASGKGDQALLMCTSGEPRAVIRFCIFPFEAGSQGGRVAKGLSDFHNRACTTQPS